MRTCCSISRSRSTTAAPTIKPELASASGGRSGGSDNECVVKVIESLLFRLFPLRAPGLNYGVRLPMFHKTLKYRTTIPFLAVLAATLSAGCSDDTRALLAPGDAQLSLKAAGPLVANQAVDITVSAAKNDGTPVSDGTEIQLSANAGDFESSKVRTQGGQAVAVFRAAGPGPVELAATSSTARGQALLFVLSALPTRISISTSTDTLPAGGGELDVTATVFGPSNEPVAGAPVEFFATNGSFAPAGPFPTNGDGKATARLATNAATQVRARVLAIDSPTIDIRIRGLGGGGEDDLPFLMSDLVWLHAPDAAEWPVTSTISAVTFRLTDGHVTQICFPHSKAGKWPRSGAGEGNVWVVAEVDGTWYAATWDYIRPGQVCKNASGFEWDDRRHGIGPHTKRPPLDRWVPRSGEQVGFMVSGFARTSQRTIRERSNIFMTEWP